jgi:hypothetical protein
MKFSVMGCSVMRCSSRIGGVVLAGCLLVGAAGCGDDDDDAADGDAAATTVATTAVTTTTSASGAPSDDAAEFCDMLLELDEQEDAPTVEQLSALEAAAPDEVAAEVSNVVARMSAAIEAGNFFAAFDDVEVQQGLSAVEAFEAESCERPVEEPAAGAAQVEVVATEYAFELDTDVAAGPTAFVMRNEGEEPHSIAVARLNQAGTLDEALAAEDSDEFVDEDLGESNTAPAGGRAVLNVDLTPGAYAILCFVTAPDGDIHAFVGQAVEFTVA